MTAVLSIASFVLAAIAYWRSGGKRDAKKLGREAQALRTKQEKLADSASQTLAATYERCSQRLEATRTRLRDMKQGGREELQKRVKRAEEQLEMLGAQVEAAAQSAKSATIAAAKNLKESIVRRVHRLEARARLVEAWDKAEKAVIAADKNRLEDAEQLLNEAAELLRSAGRILSDDHAYDEQLDVTKKAVRIATIAVQGRAADTRHKIEQVITETDRLISSLESNETRAMQQSSPLSEPSKREKVYEHSDQTRTETTAVR